MKKYLRMGFFIGMIALSLVMGCSKKQVKKDERPQAAKTEGMNERAGVVEIGYAGGMYTVLFEFDRYQLTEEARALLNQNADWLKKNQTIKVQVEGHCDGRGSEQYNLALGQKRADIVRKYLINLGVSSDRISTLSYGESRPFDDREAEEAWTKNRRAEFVITDK